MATYGAEPVSGGRDPSLLQRGREIRDDAAALRSSIERAASTVRREVGGRLRERPYQTLGFAAGLGFVLGGGIATSLARLVVTTGGRLALALAVKRVAEGFERTLVAHPESNPAADVDAG